jgi:predicted tellurium resistance membrane protein TerC
MAEHIVLMVIGVIAGLHTITVITVVTGLMKHVATLLALLLVFVLRIGTAMLGALAQEAIRIGHALT